MNLKYCTDCESILIKNYQSDKISIKCKCGKVFAPNPYDTLVKQGIILQSGSNNNSNLIDNSAFDLARKLVKKKCLTCGLDYLASSIIGTINISVIYTCRCGFQMPAKEYDLKANMK